MDNAIPVLTGTLILAVAAALPARARDPGSLARDVERLGCYDGLADAARQAASADAGRGYQTLNLTDVKLDQDSLRDRGVEVSGNLVMMGEMALLRSDAMDTSPLFVDFKGVPREQRRAMLERCGLLGCSAMVRGRVARVMTQPGIAAEGIEIR